MENHSSRKRMDNSANAGKTFDGQTESRKRRHGWDQTEVNDEETPRPGQSSFAETPMVSHSTSDSSCTEIPTPTNKSHSRWDKKPSSNDVHSTPKIKEISVISTTNATPFGSYAHHMSTPEQIQASHLEYEINERNHSLSDDELDRMFPSGYRILSPPSTYRPIRTPIRKLTSTPTPQSMLSGFHIQQSVHEQTIPSNQFEEYQPSGDLPLLKPEDLQYFDKLLQNIDEENLTIEEQKERKIMKLLLKIKNGTPIMRKSALRQITHKAREFGAEALFNQILPLFMSVTLDDQQRHLLVKVIDRILYELDELVRPYVHKICVVIEPLLVDEDYYTRSEGREIISNLSKSAGLATMISTLRPDIDHTDERIRNTTARTFAVVTSALGIPALLPFLKAVCKSQKSWQARHTGIKIIQQIAILLGCSIAPYLKSLVEIIEHGLMDKERTIQTITALTIAALAEAVTPYGIESFDKIKESIMNGIEKHRGKIRAAFLKAMGYLIPLMIMEDACHYSRKVMKILINEFQSPDDEMKRIVLKVLQQCITIDGIDSKYIKQNVIPPFFKYFWNQRMTLDRRNYRQLIDTTVNLATKINTSEIINYIVDDLKDDSELYRKMVIETIGQIMNNYGSADIDPRLEEQLIDGILYTFQQQITEDSVVLNSFGIIINILGKRCKIYIKQIFGIILWRLNNKTPQVRQQAADLIQKIVHIMELCSEEELISQMGLVLYEYLGEEYPDVLGSILGAIKSIINVIGITKMTPPIKDLLPRLTPILQNRHEKVQENCIDLIGRIAQLGAEYIPVREWIRICFQLLEIFKSHKKSIRRSAINTFGYIAKSIGPHDVLAILLDSLKVQERQLRICTTVAIAIISETCSPFTVLPGLMNEYRKEELNVQNGVLKSLSFMFEYIGEMSKDYIYAIIPLIEDAMINRDIVHRQIGMNIIGHISISVFGFGCEDGLYHLLNYVWPNIFENSPHVIQAFISAIEGLCIGLGACRIFYYILQGLFHPARHVRDVYWRVYNTIYMKAEDALVAVYPRMIDDNKRYELDYIL